MLWTDADDELRPDAAGNLWRWQTRTVSPLDVGLAGELYKVLEALEEGRLDTEELASYYARELELLEAAGIVASDTAPELRSRPVDGDADDAIETYSVDVTKWYVTPDGRAKLAQVGTFRRKHYPEPTREPVPWGAVFGAAFLAALAIVAVVLAASS